MNPRAPAPQTRSPGITMNPNQISLDDAIIEAQAMQQLFTKMTDQCFKKCITKLSDTEIQVGEGACIDRCVAKYFLVQKKVGTISQEMQQQQMQ